MTKLTENQTDTVTSYVDGYDRVKAETGLSDEELRDALLTENIEKCSNPRCGWWTDSHWLIAHDEEEPDGFCDNCREYDKGATNDHA